MEDKIALIAPGGESSWRSFWSRHHTDKRAVPVGVSPRRINKIVHGARCITQTSRCGLGVFLRHGCVQFWIDLQLHYDVEDRDGRTARDAGQGTSLVIASGGLMGHYGQSYLSTMTRRGRRQVGSCGRVTGSRPDVSLGKWCVEQRLQQTIVDEYDVSPHAFLADETGIGEIRQPMGCRLPLGQTSFHDVVDSQVGLAEHHARE